MISIEDAMKSHAGREFFFLDDKGVLKKCRVTGQCKVWKTRPGIFKLPVRFGLYHSFYITHENAENFYRTSEEAKVGGFMQKLKNSSRYTSESFAGKLIKYFTKG